MAEVHRLPKRQVLVDERGTGFRLTWHPEGDVVVLSIWHGERCSATFHLDAAATGEVANFLVTTLSEWAAQPQGEPVVPQIASNGD